MQDREPEDESIQPIEQELEVSQEEGGVLVSARGQSPVESLDVLISNEKSPEELKKLLELRAIALEQQLTQNQIKKKRTITIASSVTIAIGLGIMYSPSSQFVFVGIVILFLGVATLLNIPFDEFIKFIEKMLRIFPPKS